VVSRTVLWTRPALKNLRNLDPQQGKRIQAAVRRFAQTGEGDVKRLVDVAPPEYRLRVGNWRVRFQLLEQPEPAVAVLSVLPRDQAYR
jgi:mRNA interferase RelE/StbE